MSRLAPDRQQMLADRWEALVGRWLDSIPGDAWRGTPTDAAAALAALAGHGDHRPRNPSRLLEGVRPFIREKGWDLAFGRTRRARYVLLLRLPAGDKTNSR